MNYISAEILEINSKEIFEIEVKPCFSGYGSYFNNDESELIKRIGNRNLKLHTDKNNFVFDFSMKNHIFVFIFENQVFENHRFF